MAGSRFAAGANRRPHFEHNLNILLADGDEVARLSIKRLLHDRGHKVTEVSDGYAAMKVLAAAHGSGVDVVFADVQTAGVDGPEFVRKIGNDQDRKPIPVVVMSSEDSSQDLVLQCLGAGACECLSKPVRHNDLATLLEHVRQRIHGPNSNEAAPGNGRNGSLSSGEAAGNSGSNKDPNSGGAMEGANESRGAGSRRERSGSGEGERLDGSGAGSGAGGGSGGGSGSNGSGGGTDGSGSNGRGEEQSSAGSRSLRPPAALHLPIGGPSSNYHSSEGASDTSSRLHFANNLKAKAKGLTDPPTFKSSAKPPSEAAAKQGSEGEEDEIGGSGGEGSPDTDEQDREDGQRQDREEQEIGEGDAVIDDREPKRSQMPRGGNRVLPRGLLELAHLGNRREQEAHAIAMQQQKSYNAIMEDEVAARARHQQMVAQKATSSLKHSNSCSAFSAFGAPGDAEDASYYHRYPHDPHGHPPHPGYGHHHQPPPGPRMDPGPYGHHQGTLPPPYSHHHPHGPPPPPYPYPMMHPMMHGWGPMGLGAMPPMPHAIRPPPPGMGGPMGGYYDQAAAAMQMSNALRGGPPPSMAAPSGRSHGPPPHQAMTQSPMKYSSPQQPSPPQPQSNDSGNNGNANNQAGPHYIKPNGQLSVHGFPNSQVRRQQALAKFREKRKNRNFDRKVRYESRKRLAEERPRVKGQFVKRSELQGTDGSNSSASNTAATVDSRKEGTPPATDEMAVVK